MTPGPHGQDPEAELYTAVAANNAAGSWGDVGAIDPSNPIQPLIYNGGLQVEDRRLHGVDL